MVSGEVKAKGESEKRHLQIKDIQPVQIFTGEDLELTGKSVRFSTCMYGALLLYLLLLEPHDC